jgi:hypothetical protein
MSKPKNASRLLVSLIMQAREYKHRLTILGIVLVLPLLFWSSSYYSAGDGLIPIEIITASGTKEIMVSERESWPSITGIMGVAWAASTAAFYAMIGSFKRDKRLVLCGYRSWEIL